MNPVLPLYYAAPDVEAHVFKTNPDRLYMYCSNDRIDGGGMDPYQNVFSTENLVHWMDHGIAFDARKEVTWTKQESLAAIDAIEKDGKYYYYFTSTLNGVSMQFVAFSDTPEGPFTNPKPIYGTEFPSCGDPAIFVDDDGKAYLYWGQFSLRSGQLMDNMYELIPETVNTMLITEDEHGFHEGSSMRKRGDTYYLIYADTDRGAPTCLSYAKSKSPLGPFTKGGVIIDNINSDIAAWNNHGSITCFHDQWYVAYHRPTLGFEMGGRRACLEPIEFDENGDIKEVLMTTQGVEGPISPLEWMDAYRACEFYRPAGLQGRPNIDGAFFWKRDITGWRENMYLGAIRHGNELGVRTAHVILEDVHSEYLTKFSPGEAAIYRYFDFGTPVCRFICEAASYIATTHLEIRLDAPDGQCIGTCVIEHTGGWQNWKEFSCEIAPVTGIHALYLVACKTGNGNRLCDLKRFRFE